MFKTVLVPVSLSGERAEAERAITTAVSLAKQQGASLRVITVLPGFGSPWVASYFPKQDMEKIRKDLYDELRNLVQPLVPDDLTVKLKALDGTPYKRILEEAERVKADLIVINSHSKKTMERLFLGSVAARVVERAGCSVFVVRPNHQVV